MESSKREEIGFLGQPRGLSTLFFTEMWERFSYYGMRAILVFYLYAKVTDVNAGLGLSQTQAASIMSIYGALVYMSTIMGGWLGDRVLGGSKTVFFGAIFIMFGHIALATPFGFAALFVSIALIVVGTGMLKANVSNLVGLLYTENDVRRDVGFSIFVMGINIGSLLAPIIVGTVGQKVNFHLGFLIAAFGILFALIVFYVERKKYFSTIGEKPTNPLSKAERKSLFITLTLLSLLLIIVFGGLIVAGKMDIPMFINLLSVVGVFLPIYYFTRMLTSKEVSKEEKTKIFAYIPLFISAIIFWSIEEQGSSILALYGQNRTNLSAHFLGIQFKIEASWFQTLNPLFIVLFAPLFVKLWTKLGDRQPSTVVKFAIGLLLTGLSYVVLLIPGVVFGTDVRVSPWWLVCVFAIMMAGELCVSPVGLSVTTKLAPKAFQSQTIAIWFLADATSQVINAQIAQFFKPATEVAYFGINGLVAICFGILLFLIKKPIQDKMLGIK